METASPVFDPTGTHTLEVMAAADQFNKWMYDTIAPYLTGEILEIGTGIANISIYALRDKKSITLSDINPEYREQLSTRFGNSPTLKGVLSIDLQHPEFNTAYHELENKYDSIFMLNVIEHLADDKAAMENCRFMLKNNAHLVVLAPSYPFLYCRLDKELGHYRRYRLNTLARLADPKDTLIKKNYFNAGGIAGWLLFGKMLQRPQLGVTEAKAYNRLVPVFKFIDRLLLRSVGLSSIIIAKINK